ncbi:formylglycine-generating enzyme family protein [Streptomyces sp. NBC_00094]|uniref:formylglycine-generating enzyme family protein n=1 Tax=Streptomyces sp. NBC_00094 TaxID=2903620 RepID=UPI0022520C13|nr:formylglycine-generating enzyme family protein [Streptomyces sp. NBC_00094]MCX5390551.1 formylglycine-generating enzyme family protein [Streptomyces sp. NBC_00094]
MLDQASTDVRTGMIHLPGGDFTMGSDHAYPDEQPAHRARVGAFWIDPHPVTNDAFAAFVEATGHVTLAEIAPRAEDYPGAPAELLVAGSSVFRSPGHPVDLSDAYQWWSFVPGADWRHPYGPDSSIDGLGDHPAVHVGYADALAYAAWAGKELPTEAEWEYAARGGSEGTEYAWGDELVPGGRLMANTWHGDFPVTNHSPDGRLTTAPVGSYPANGHGLYDMIGNVWEWTHDYYAARHPVEGAGCCAGSGTRAGGAGGDRKGSVDPALAEFSTPRRVMKGGSFLCSPNYCRRYRPAARMPQAEDTATCHLGFRCVVRDPS